MSESIYIQPACTNPASDDAEETPSASAYNSRAQTDRSSPVFAVEPGIGIDEKIAIADKLDLVKLIAFAEKMMRERTPESNDED